jgi:TolA-binding protein
MGMISVNKHDVNSSIEYYKRILQELPQSAEAQDALTGLENVYSEADRSDEFTAFLEKNGLTSTKSAAEKENLAYNTAERQYVNGKYINAVTSLKKYISDYPQGSKLANAYFYLGESLNKSGKMEEALDCYLKVMEMGEGSFTELATLNYARNSYKLENYTQAYKAFASLENIAKIDNNKIEAKLGMVNSLFMDKQYKEAVNIAVNINNTGLDDERKTRLKFVIAKSRFMTGERATAVSSLKELSKNYASAEGAESNYLLILNAFESGNFKEVENLVFAFSDTKTPQKYWLARSYVVLGDSYVEREEWEQAKATFNSILESYKPVGNGDDIAGLIKTKLNNIKIK